MRRFDLNRSARVVVASLAITLFAGEARAQIVPGQFVMVTNADGSMIQGRVTAVAPDNRLVVQVQGANGRAVNQIVDNAHVTLARQVGDHVLYTNPDGSVRAGVITRVDADGTAIVLTPAPEGGLKATPIDIRALASAPTRQQAEQEAINWLTQVGDGNLGVNPLCGEMNCGGTAISLDRSLAGTPATSMDFDGMYVSDMIANHPGGNFQLARGGPDEIREILERAGPGARAIVWGDRGPGVSGHYFNVVNWNGQVLFLDGQPVYRNAAGVPFQGGDLADLSPRQGYVRVSILRTDNLPGPAVAVRPMPQTLEDLLTGGATTQPAPVVRPPPEGTPPVVEGPRPPAPLVNEPGEPGGKPESEAERNRRLAREHPHLPKIPKAGVVGVVIGAAESIGNSKHDYDRIRNEGGSVTSALVHGGGQILDGITLGAGPASKGEYDRIRNEGGSMTSALIHGGGQILDKLTVGAGPAMKTEYDRSRNNGGNMLVAGLHAAGQPLDLLTLGAGPASKGEYDRIRNEGGSMTSALVHGGGQILDRVTLGVGPKTKQKYDESRNNGDNMLVSGGKALLSGVGSLFGF